MLRSRFGWSEAERNLAGDRAELRIPEAVDAEVEIASRRHVRIEARVVRPGVEVTANQRDLDVVRVAAKADTLELTHTEVIAHRELTQLHVRAALDEVVAGVQTVVETTREEGQRDLLVLRLAALVFISMAEVL